MLIICVSDDLQYLTNNFSEITEEFLETRSNHSHRLKIKQEVIKIMDRSTQTDPTETDSKLRSDYLELKRKYETVKQDLKRIKLTLKGCEFVFSRKL